MSYIRAIIIKLTSCTLEITSETRYWKGRMLVVQKKKKSKKERILFMHTLCYLFNIWTNMDLTSMIKHSIESIIRSRNNSKAVMTLGEYKRVMHHTGYAIPNPKTQKRLKPNSQCTNKSHQHTNIVLGHQNCN